MVISWILNSISREIVEGFVYANSAKELWEEIKERFGESNGPLLYHLQKDISNLSQGVQSVVVYFSKLQQLLDEYSSLMPHPDCSCGASKILAEREMNSKLIQFLMGLNNDYDHVKNQILLMEPLPSINKAYLMVLSIEKQRTVSGGFSEVMENPVMVVREGGFARTAANMFQGKPKQMLRKIKKERAKLICEHCKGPGREIHECFKLTGYPEWDKKLKEQRNKHVINMTEVNHKEHIGSAVLPDLNKSVQFTDMVAFIQQEITKYMSNRATTGAGSGDGSMNFANYAEFAGPT